MSFHHIKTGCTIAFRFLFSLQHTFLPFLKAQKYLLSMQDSTKSHKNPMKKKKNKEMFGGFDKNIYLCTRNSEMHIYL